MAKSKGFQFKQFFIEHSNCAMKVGTDSIMLGSWLDVAGAKHILDVGTGSGILAVMLAQKSAGDAQITGIDIDAAAIIQANCNGQGCLWSSRINFSHQSLQNFVPEDKFDLIVSNPPYFPVYGRSGEQAKQGAGLITHQQRQTARQTGELSHQHLLQSVAGLLTEKGRFSCVLPAQNSEDIVDYAAQLGLQCHRRLLVRAKPEGKIIRHLLEFGRYSLLRDESIKIEHLHIYQQKKQYSQAYINLCKDYYLKF
jgi:tRNA1Val (adenine37-N6)-methyltransferase